MPAPEAKLRASRGPGHLTELFGRGFVALYFSNSAHRPGPLGAGAGAAMLRQVRVATHGAPAADTVVDELGQAWARYGAAEGTLYLIRPDGYVMGRWREAESLSSIDSILQHALEAPTA
jgi:3-(3-hydroxy-phenyl)propionate hydroxylase